MATLEHATKTYDRVFEKYGEKMYDESVWFLEFCVNKVFREYPKLESFSILPIHGKLKVCLEGEMFGFQGAKNCKATMLRKELEEVDEKYPLFADQVRRDIEAEIEKLEERWQRANRICGCFARVPVHHAQRKFGTFEEVTFYRDGEPHVKPWVVA